MAWRNLLKRKEPDESAEPTAPPDEQVVGRRPRVSLSDPAVRYRRRTRLERRIKDLRFDIEKAETALEEQNRWSERVAEINQAIDQGKADATEILKPSNPQQPVALEPLPIEINHVEPGRNLMITFVVGEDDDPGDPADIRFTIGPVSFRYTDEIDWSERGHNRSEAELRRVDGDINLLLPDDLPESRRVALHDHLAHSLSTYAEALQTNAFDGQPQPELTLADMAVPCPVCGQWRDWKDRCPSCQRRQWEATQIQDEIDRLYDERDQQLEEAQSWRERLPILRRQLSETEKELLKYLDPE